ncbi:hypothetical protein Bhyg_04732, partial [Pseudolycoriella hygida]
AAYFQFEIFTSIKHFLLVKTETMETTVKILLDETQSEASEAIEVKPPKRNYEDKLPAASAKGQKKNPMPTYGKYNILKILKENNCLLPKEEELCKAFPRNKRYDLNDIKKFVNKAARKSQSITEKNNRSPEFKRANDLIESIKECIPFSERSLALPLCLKTITDVFSYEEEALDVRMLYQTLTNLSLGLPTPPLNNETNDFLYGLYKEFVDQMNSPQFKEDVLKYQEFFNNGNESNNRREMKHPTEDSDMRFVIEHTLNCPSVNPLNIPFALLHKPKLE